MKPKTLILMVVAVVCGLGASYMTSRLLAERDDKPAEAPPLEKIKILVTKNKMPMHAPLRSKPEDFFVEKEFVKDDAPKDALTMADMPKLKDKFLRRSMRKGDHLTQEDLLDGNGTLKQLENGMRAVGIRLSPEQQASGFACIPGSHVDIHWTRRVGNDKDTFTKILLKDVVVLASDINSTASEGGQAMLANVVTVALNDQDTMKVTLAIQTGSLMLVVRNLGDKTTTDVGADSLTMDQLLKGNSPTPKVDVPPVVADATPPDNNRPDTLNNRGNPDLPMKATPPEPEPKPQLPKLKKMTVTVRNNQDVKISHYWVDEQDNIASQAQVQQYLDQLEQNGNPPSPGNKEQPKKLTPDV